MIQELTPYTSEGAMDFAFLLTIFQFWPLFIDDSTLLPEPCRKTNDRYFFASAAPKHIRSTTWKV
jgi:hypothetical protein